MAAGEEVGEAEARGVFAGHDAGARGRADGTGGVGVGEAHATGGEAVDVGSFVEAAAVEADVAPAEVVDQDEDEVKASGRGGRWELGRKGGGGCCFEEAASVHVGEIVDRSVSLTPLY